MIPGSNLLNMALSVIAPQKFTYYAFVSRKTGINGLDVATYASPMRVRGSVQPVPRSMYETLGLNLQKTYVNIFIARNIVDLNRDVSGDYIIFGYTTQPGPFQIGTDSGSTITTDDGKVILTDAPANPAKYKCISATSWYQQDGWTQVLCVGISDAG